jgi:hypothetical protein
MWKSHRPRAEDREMRGSKNLVDASRHSARHGRVKITFPFHSSHHAIKQGVADAGRASIQAPIAPLHDPRMCKGLEGDCCVVIIIW